MNHKLDPNHIMFLSVYNENDVLTHTYDVSATRDELVQNFIKAHRAAFPQMTVEIIRYNQI